MAEEMNHIQRAIGKLLTFWVITKKAVIFSEDWQAIRFSTCGVRHTSVQLQFQVLHAPSYTHSILTALFLLCWVKATHPWGACKNEDTTIRQAGTWVRQTHLNLTNTSSVADVTTSQQPLSKKCVPSEWWWSPAAFGTLTSNSCLTKTLLENETRGKGAGEGDMVTTVTKAFLNFFFLKYLRDGGIGQHRKQHKVGFDPQAASGADAARKGCSSVQTVEQTKGSLTLSL